MLFLYITYFKNDFLKCHAVMQPDLQQLCRFIFILNCFAVAFHS